MKTISASVKSGKNLCEKIVNTHNNDLKNITGMMLFPGSLNVLLDKPIKFKNGIQWAPWREDWNDYDKKDLIPATINDQPVFLQRNLKTRLNETSILAEIPLRKTYNLLDGDKIDIVVKEKYIEKMSKLEYFRWYLNYFILNNIYKRYFIQIVPKNLKRRMRRLIQR